VTGTVIQREYVPYTVSAQTRLYLPVHELVVIEVKLDTEKLAVQQVHVGLQPMVDLSEYHSHISLAVEPTNEAHVMERSSFVLHTKRPPPGPSRMVTSCGTHVV